MQKQSALKFWSPAYYFIYFAGVASFLPFLALVLPGGVDRSGEVRVIPAFLALIERLARSHELHVFALRQEARPGSW